MLFLVVGLPDGLEEPCLAGIDDLWGGVTLEQVHLWVQHLLGKGNLLLGLFLVGGGFGRTRFVGIRAGFRNGIGAFAADAVASILLVVFWASRFIELIGGFL